MAKRDRHVSAAPSWKEFVKFLSQLEKEVQ